MTDVVRHRRWGIVAVVTAGTMLTAVILNRVLHDESDAGPTERRQAEALLHQATRLAQAGDLTDLCQSVAATVGMCRSQLHSAQEAGWEPGPKAPTVVAVTERPTSLILHLTGTRLDGTGYTADFEVIRDGEELRSRTPVYWSGVNLVLDSECGTTANHAACRDTVPQPTT